MAAEDAVERIVEVAPRGARDGKLRATLARGQPAEFVAGDEARMIRTMPIMALTCEIMQTRNVFGSGTSVSSDYVLRAFWG